MNIRQYILDKISNSGLTIYKIAKLTGCSESLLGRFKAGQRGLSLESVQLVLDVCGPDIIYVNHHDSVVPRHVVRSPEEAIAFVKDRLPGVELIVNEGGYGWKLGVHIYSYEPKYIHIVFEQHTLG